MTSVEITAQDIGAQEWMGLSAKVTESTDPSRVGVLGRVVGETKNTLVLETKTGEIVLPKPEVTMEFEVVGKKLRLDMKNWCFRPEDRIKVWAKKKK
ncbi:MAG: ribonuclease P protein subunit [Candidatus Diapherotrites archaeon]|nr:ribonuclease P protein subunit [Candidatus Diapherotrites archaeon]